MNYADYAEKMRGYAGLAELSEYGVIRDSGKDYPLFRIRAPGSRLLVITAGFHGEEPAGPLTLLEYLPKVLEWARARDVGLLVYPCLNPTGFEDGTRYNRAGEKPNNDFLRYEVAPGVLKGELNKGDTFQRWMLYDGGPAETRALRQELEKQPTPNAALDLHQDRYTPGEWTYAYTFGPREVYRPIVEEASKHLRIASHQKVDEVNVSDDLGLVEYNDGSVTDYYLRRGVPYAAALETTTHAPMELCHQVNLVWIRGFIELAAR